MDRDGYPDDPELERIRTWSYTDPLGVLRFIADLWRYPDYWTEIVGEDGMTTFYISTGGWSGNELLIDALQENYIVWGMCWVSSKRGGHYVCEVRKETKNG